jgi:hypothetical protein
MSKRYKTVYSRDVTLALMCRGFGFYKRVRNPDNPQLHCWLFEDTKGFRKAFNEIVASSKASKSNKEEEEDGNK